MPLAEMISLAEKQAEVEILHGLQMEQSYVQEKERIAANEAPNAACGNKENVKQDKAACNPADKPEALPQQRRNRSPAAPVANQRGYSVPPVQNIYNDQPHVPAVNNFCQETRDCGPPACPQLQPSRADNRRGRSRSPPPGWKVVPGKHADPAAGKENVQPVAAQKKLDVAPFPVRGRSKSPAAGVAAAVRGLLG